MKKMREPVEEANRMPLDGKKPDSGKPKGSGKRRKKKKRGWIAVMILFLVALIAAVFCYFYFLKPSDEWVDHREYFGLADGVSYGLIVNQDRIGSYPVKRGGYWYLDLDTVHSYVSTKMYFDGETLLYTNPVKTYFAEPGAYQYTDDGELSYQLDYQPCYRENGHLYVALEYLKLMDFDYYLDDKDNQYLWVWNCWSGLQAADVTKKSAAVRYGSGVKYPIVDEVSEGETVLLLEEGTNWMMVQTPRGMIGCIRKSELGEAYSMTAKTPDGRPLPAYTGQAMEETVCMAWQQVFTESGYKQLDDLLEDAQGLNVITPTWFTISDNEGNIKSLAETRYVNKAHRAGLQVWGMVENINIEVDESQVLGVTEHRRHLVEELMAEAKRVKLDGINIDLEAVGEANGAHLLQFIREMSAACRNAGLVLSVDNYSPMPHTAYYDRAQQAEMVDYVIVMAYDEHYVGDEVAGSTATVNWVHQSASRTLEEVPKEKLIVGLPFYTRLWKETPQAYAAPDARLFTREDSRFGTYSLTSEGISMGACGDIVREHHLSMSWLSEEGQYYAEYEEDHSLYRLWIEDETSMELKLQAAFSYQPAGVAFFKIGLESKGVWRYIDSYLN